jgi:hypothetical protein
MEGIGMTKRVIFRFWLAAVLASGANADADTYLTTSAASRNFGSAARVNIGGGNTGLIQFDLGGLPAGLRAVNINTATMTLFRELGSGWGCGRYFPR